MVVSESTIQRITEVSLTPTSGEITSNNPESVCGKGLMKELVRLTVVCVTNCCGVVYSYGSITTLSQ